MDKCDCWHKVNFISFYPDVYDGVCHGTKEMEYCKCHGDMSKCDFYPEKRKNNKKMQTLEMMIAAKENGKTYVHNNIYYSDCTGFKTPYRLSLENYHFDGTLNALLDFEWEVSQKILTRVEAEEKYNIKIIG